MQVVRTIVWIAVTVVLVAFIAMNWERAPVNVWPLENDYLHFDWPVGVIALVFFLFGLLPTWAMARLRGWRLRRRISSLENTMRATSVTVPVTPPPTAVAPIDDGLVDERSSGAGL